MKAAVIMLALAACGYPTDKDVMWTGINRQYAVCHWARGAGCDNAGDCIAEGRAYKCLFDLSQKHVSCALVGPAQNAEKP